MFYCVVLFLPYALNSKCPPRVLWILIVCTPVLWARAKPLTIFFFKGRNFWIRKIQIFFFKNTKKKHARYLIGEKEKKRFRRGFIEHILVYIPKFHGLSLKSGAGIAIWMLNKFGAVALNHSRNAYYIRRYYVHTAKFDENRSEQWECYAAPSARDNNEDVYSTTTVKCSGVEKGSSLFCDHFRLVPTADGWLWTSWSTRARLKLERAKTMYTKLYLVVGRCVWYVLMFFHLVMVYGT